MRMDLNECAPQNLPWDSIGPGMRKQVTQAGFAGPFVIRSNPIGALVDTIRGWCFPTPMQATDDGQYQDLSGMGLDSPALGYGGDVGYPGGAFVPMIPSYVPPQGASCPAGQSWDPMSQLCQPSDMLGIPGTAASFPGDVASLQTAQQMLLDAYSNCDLPGVTAVLRTAGVQAKLAPGDLGNQWNQLAKAASQAYNDLIKRKNRKPVAGENDPCAMGGTMAAMNNQVMAASAGQMNRKLPAMPNPQTMTEGNVRMQPTLNPMVGMLRAPVIKLR